MPAKATARRTPSEIIGRIVQAAMAANGVNAQELAKRSNVHPNTVYTDMKNPDKMPLSRLWLYFLALDVPIDDALRAFAEAHARAMVGR